MRGQRPPTLLDATGCASLSPGLSASRHSFLLILCRLCCPLPPCLVALVCLLPFPFPTPWSKCSNLLVVNWQEQGGGGGGGVVDPVSVASAICGRVACIGRRRRTALMPACLARNVS